MADVDDMPPPVQQEVMGGEEGEVVPEVPEKYDNLTQEQQDEIKEVFEIFDKENNQTIEKGMLSTVMRWLKFNPTEREINEYYKKYDPNNTGVISLKSVMAIINIKMLDSDTLDELVEALKLFDNEKTGKLAVSELRWALTKLGDCFEEQQVDDMLKEIDKEATGTVDLLEFAKICFNIKEEKPKEAKDAKKDAPKKKK